MIEGDDIEISLDEDRPIDFSHRILRPMQVIEKTRFVEQLRLGRIQILRIATVERTSAKSDQRSRLAVDGDHEAVSKPIVVPRSTLSRHHQTRQLERLLTMLARQPGQDVVPGVGGIAESVLLDDLLPNAAVIEVSPRRVVRKSERLMECLRGLVDDFEKVVFVAFLRCLAPTRQLDAHARRHMLHGFREREALGEREKLEDVAARATAEAIKQTLGAVDMK